MKKNTRTLLFVAALAMAGTLFAHTVGNPAATYEEVVRHPEIVACLKRGLEVHNKSSGGSSSLRVARAMLMVEPPSIDGNELTDKGYINQRAGLERRAQLVERLYADRPDEDVIVLQ